MAGLGAIVAFAETARRGGFAPAARELGLSASAVAKSVARLEADLGVRLFHRTTRNVSLTSEGRGLFERCERIAAEMQAIRDEASGARVEPSGMLRLNVPITLGKRWIVPALARLARKHPQLKLDVAFTDRYADLAAEGLDAAVRVGALADNTLVARPIGRQQLVVCASPAYLRAHGKPVRIADLERHRSLAFRIPSSGRLMAWRFLEGGKPLEWTPSPRFAFDDGEALVAAAVEGLGLIYVPDNMAAEELRRGRVKEVLRANRPAPMPISIVYLSSRGMTPRLRAFIAEVGGAKK